MEIKITTTTMLKILYLLSWIIFIGLCIEAGGFLTNTIYTLAVDSKHASHFWAKLDFSELYRFSSNHFVVITVQICIISILKALLFYCIVKVLHDKKLNLTQPFNTAIGKFISNMAYITLFIGFFSMWSKNYINWIESKNVVIPNIELLKIGGADVWLFMGIVLLVIAQIFKKGIEIQKENELTI